MNVESHPYLHSDHTNIIDYDQFHETKTDYPYNDESYSYNHFESDNSSDLDIYSCQEIQNSYDSDPYANSYGLSLHQHHKNYYSEDLTVVENVSHQRLGSEMNPYHKAYYYEHDVIMYRDKNGIEHKGKILDINGYEYTVQRADGTCVIDKIGFADIEGAV